MGGHVDELMMQTMRASPAVLLMLSAAGVLLLIGGAAVWRQGLAFEYATQDPEDAPTLADNIAAAVMGAGVSVMGSPVADMRPSTQLLAMLKRGERLELRAYDLGDGGLTIGYGRFYKHGGPVPPASITQAQAEEWFTEDVEARAAKWVRAYVSAPLLQHQFDALCHMAYNLSPKAFRTIAQAVNAGDDPEGAALQFIRAGSNLERGLRNRRGREIALYRTGVYA